VARIRTIKPEFFQHEGLFDVERSSGLPLRIAFAGLWTVADRSGRFEWRPRQLKLNILPYDECDFSAVLSSLESAGFVQRYDVEGKSYGYIPSWEKHQHINVREPSSTLPPPSSQAGNEPEQVHDGCEAGACTDSVPYQSAGKGREGKGKGKEREGACAPTTPGLDRESWDRWITYRRATGKPIKSASEEAAVDQLSQLMPRLAELLAAAGGDPRKGARR